MGLCKSFAVRLYSLADMAIFDTVLTGNNAVDVVVELTLVIGNYSFLAFVINAFDPELPSDRSEPLLPG